MKRIVFLGIAIILGACSQSENRSRSEEAIPESREIEDNSIINLYDAFGEENEGLIKDFGFSCIVKFNGTTILFDGGTNADVFQNNIEALNIYLTEIDFAIASHAHFDHINGFDYLLKVKIIYHVKSIIIQWGFKS